MKKALHLIPALILTLAVSTGSVLAGNGPSAQGAGSTSQGAGLQQTILLGEPGTVSGTVAQAGTTGQGYVIDDGVEQTTLYGIGPASYWDSLGVALPEVGEEIFADVYWVTFSDGTVKAIAVSVTVGDTEVVLRDEETGQPLWRGNSGQDGGTGGGLQDGSCLNQ